MAWLSVGTSNSDLIQKMIQNGVFEEGPILEAFRVTDRGDFVNPEDRLQAYSDRPLKRGFIHLSAPHMYATVLKALDLKSGKSFLNIGSGSGYLSCLAAYLLGEEGVSHGVEISESACQFSRENAKRWHAKLMNKLKEEESSGVPMPSVISPDGIAFVTANCFDIDVLSAVSTMKYDRIYIGAGCPESRKEFFLSMLADNGIMVAPINEKNQMIVIRKFCGRVYNSKPISQVNFAPLLDTSVRADEPALLAELASMESSASLNSDIQQTIQKVQAASVSSSFIFHPLPFTGVMHQHHQSSGSSGSSPSSTMLSGGSLMHGNNNTRILTEETVVRVRLPALVWAPLRGRHLQFPPDFRKAVFTILLANNQSHQYSSNTYYPTQHPQQLQSHYHFHRAGPVDRGWGCLPHHIWLYIFTYASRDWFCVPKSEVQALSTELAVERRLRRTAEDKLRKAETARRAAEQERDLYRLALERLKQRHKHHNSGTSLGAALWAHVEDSASEIDFDEVDEEQEDEEEEFEEDNDLMEAEDEAEAEWNEEMEHAGAIDEAMEASTSASSESEEDNSVTITEGEIESEPEEEETGMENAVPVSMNASASALMNSEHTDLAVLDSMVQDAQHEPLMPRMTASSTATDLANSSNGSSTSSHSVPESPPFLRGAAMSGIYSHPFSSFINHQYPYQELQQGSSGLLVGSLSSDATCTTMESASLNSNDPHMAVAGTSAVMPATSYNNNTSRASGLSFSAEERISDCTDASTAAHNEDEDSGFDTSEQFATDEML